ncbi:ADP-L-glycero-D-manno-heptose-6-epimerase [subsurface metagenome]
MKNKKVVVTGGCGFVGSSLAEELLKDNKVIIIDDLSTGKITNIKDLLEKDNVEFIRGSITNLNLLENVFKDVEYVFHQAAIPSVPRSVRNPLRTNNANINGTLNVLIAARDNSVKKVVYASTSSVYGDTPTLLKKRVWRQLHYRLMPLLNYLYHSFAISATSSIC